MIKRTTMILSDVADIITEKKSIDNFSRENYISTINMLCDLRGVEQIDELPEKGKATIFKNGDTLFSNIRVYFRKVWFAEYNGGSSPDVLVFRPKLNVIHPIYLNAIISNKNFTEYAISTSNGGKMPRADKQLLLKYPIELPDIETQTKEIRILQSIKQYESNNLQLDSDLIDYASSLFKSWFFDFDPVKAKVEGRQPFGMDEETAELFPDSFEDSSLGPIPAGWKVEKYLDSISLHYGSALKKENRNGGNIPVYGSNGIIGFHDSEPIFGPGIVIGRKGNPGIVNWVNEDFFPIDTAFFVKTKHNENLLFYYFSLLLAQLPWFATDSAVPGINRNAILSIKYILPPDELIVKFLKFAIIKMDAIHNNKKMVHDSAELRDALLPRLMSGELSVEGLED